jgi:hypothetical protein
MGFQLLPFRGHENEKLFQSFIATPLYPINLRHQASCERSENCQRRSWGGVKASIFKAFDVTW